MLKKWFPFLCFLLLSAQQFASASKMSSDWVMGDEWVARIKKEYQEGKFASFLEESRTRYEKECANSPVAKEDSPSTQKVENPAAQPGAPLTTAMDLNAALQEALSKYSPSRIHAIYDSFNRKPSLSEKHYEAFMLVEAALWKETPPYNTPFAKRIQKILREYAIRDDLLHTQWQYGQISSEQNETCQLVNHLEKYRCLREAAEGQDEELALSISPAYEVFLQNAPLSHDGSYIFALAFGQQTPENACEKEVATVTKQFLEQFTKQINQKIESTVKSSIHLPFCSKTEHFELYCSENDQKVGMEMVQNLEDRFAEITSRYAFVPPSPLCVVIYPDTKSFHEAIGWPEAPEWLVESWGGGLMQMVSPNDPDNVHSYTSRAHLSPIDTFIGSLLGTRYTTQAPYWLHVGVPLCESGRFIVEEKERGNRIMKEYIEKNGFPEIEELENKPFFNKNRLSSFATTLVAFIVKTKGFDTVLELLKDYSRFEEIMGQSKASVREGWIEFLNTTHLKDSDLPPSSGGEHLH